MPEDYNKMYDRLVSSDDDFIGLMAYVMYKREKRNFIIQHKLKKFRQPNEAEMDDFMTFAATRIDSYKKEGADFYFKCVGSAVQNRLEQNREYENNISNIANIVESADQRLEDIERSFNEHEKLLIKRTYNKKITILLNLAGTALFSALLAVGYIYLHTSERNTSAFMDHLTKSQKELVVSSDSTSYEKVEGSNHFNKK